MKPELWNTFVAPTGEIVIDQGIPPTAYADLRSVSESKTETFDFYRKYAELRDGRLFVPGTADAAPDKFCTAVDSFVKKINKAYAASELSKRYKSVAYMPEMRPGESLASYMARRARLSKQASSSWEHDRDRDR